MADGVEVGVAEDVSRGAVEGEGSWRDRLKQESNDRGWLFSVVAAWCVIMGLLCTSVAALAAIKWLWGEGASAESVVRMIVVGLVILISTFLMWRLNVWGRNVAIVTVGCVSWVVGEAISRKAGVGIGAQLLTVVFSAMALSCFTGSRVRALFEAKKWADEEQGDETEVVVPQGQPDRP